MQWAAQRTQALEIREPPQIPPVEQLSAGAMDDAAAWCLLAVVLSSFESNATIAALAIGGGAAYAILTLTVGRWALKSLGKMAEREGKVTPAMLSLAMMLMMFSSWITDAIGIYAVFGAFILGCAMPRGVVRSRTDEAG